MSYISGYHAESTQPWFLRESRFLAHDREDARMLVPNVVRKTVVFIGARRGKKFKPLATGFVVSVVTGGYRFIHIVTAEHVLVGMQSKGIDKPSIRVNLVEGGTDIFDAEYNKWFYHPDVAKTPTDVAVLPCSIDRGGVIYAHVPIDDFAVGGVIEEEHIGIGDEIFSVGLFKSHYGEQQNIPVLRTGNIALMPEEPVKTKYAGYMEGYLIEARSISGLSGSPVWVHMPPFRVIKSQVEMAEKKQYYLLGLMHGHFDVKNLNEDIVLDDDQKDDQRGINTGIGVVIPAQKIAETINQPDLEQQRQAIASAQNESGGAVPDVDLNGELELPTKGENPQHRGDFNRLLDAAARGKRSDDQT